MFEVLRISSNTYCDYNSLGFTLFLRKRLDVIIQKLKDGINIFNIDTDVLLFEKEEFFAQQLIPPMDIIAQREHSNMFCFGFMVIKSNPKTIEYFAEIAKIMNKDIKLHDQKVGNEIYKKFNINVGLFSTQDVTSYGLISGGKQWNGEAFEVPKCKAFHANYTVGLRNKNILLAKAKAKNG